MTDPRGAELAERLDEVRRRVESARRSAGRTDDDPTEVVVVTKFHPVDDVLRLARLGVRDFGENRAQEAAAKCADLAGLDERAAESVRWHMIGHIQSKKAASVAAWADRVHSVDSVRVADGLDRGRGRALESGERQGELPVLLQLSLDGAAGRGGVVAEDLLALADHVAGSEHLALAGLMVVPPLQGEPAAHFATAARVRERLRQAHPGAVEFSAGMTGDMEEAIAAGSTCVRVGTAILGPRPVL